MPRKIAPLATRVAKLKELRTPESGHRKASRRFLNSEAWHRLRRVVLAEQPLCAHCLERGELTEASHVDHIVPRHERPDLALDRSNLQSLCHSCHSRKTQLEDRRR